MSATLVRPVVITPEMVVSTTVAESHAAWSASTTYALDARAIRGRLVYQSVLAGNVGHEPGVSSQWVPVGPTNAWAMFDGRLGVATESAGAFSVVLRPGAINTLVALEMRAASIRVVMRNAGVVVYDATRDLSRTFVNGWYEWTFAPFFYLNECVFGDLPLYPAAEVEITVQSDTLNPARCGEVVMGTRADLGDVVMGAKLGFTDYSRKETDEFGNTTLVQRAAARDVNLSFVFDASQLSQVASLLTGLRATPCVLLPASLPRFGALVVYGWIGDMAIDLQTARKYFCTLQFKGLT